MKPSRFSLRGVALAAALLALAAAPAVASAEDLGSNPWAIASAGSSHYFSADDGLHGRELWRTVGDATTPELVADLAPGPESASPWQFTPVGDTLYFQAKDSTYLIPAMGGGLTPGDRLYRTDGTAAGTHVVTIADGVHPESVQKWGDHLVFTTKRPGTAQVVDFWLADLDGSGAQKLTAGLALTGAGALTDLGDGHAVFAARASGVDDEPWITDGTPAGTRLVADVWPGDHWSNPMEFASLGGGTFTFIAYDAVHGRELWGSDGTAAGTQLLKDIQPGANSSQPSAPVLFNGKYYFWASFGSPGPWTTDGTPAGTHPAGPESWSAFGERLANGLIVRVKEVNDNPSAGNYQLYASDGTEAGTHMVKELFPGGTLFQETLVVDGVLYFTATANHDNSGDMELWRSDGTADGTYVVADINPNGSSSPVWLRDFGDGHVGFVADDGVHGKEPWISDGTPEGTKIINIHTTTPLVVDDPSPSAGDTTEPSPTVPAQTRSALGTRALVATALAPTPAPDPALTLTVAKKADAALPFRYSGHGALSARGACAGTVTVSLTRGARPVGRATAKVAKDCTYRATVSKATMKNLARKGGRLTLAARFNGNTATPPVRSQAATVRYGRS